MEKKHDVSVFIFRRDLRLDDNTGLIKALDESKYVIPLFICTPAQLSNDNKYKSSNCVQFMMESLYDLDKQIKKFNTKYRLWITYSTELNAIRKIYKEFKPSAIYVNEDYTPYSIKRDNEIKKFCIKNKIIFNQHTDILLLDTNNITTNNGNRYHIFTQFYKKTVNNPIRKPDYDVIPNFKSLPSTFKNWQIKVVDQYLLKNNFYEINENIAINGGRTNGLEILDHMAKFKNYQKTRNMLSIQTTMLSAHNKFGTVSIREVYYAFKKKAKSIELCKQLYWRDFYYYIGVYYKNFYKHDHIVKIHNEKSKTKWENSSKYLKAWTEARTGFPIVDAAMREINTTGFMHNRGRLIVASFLVKDLLVDWKYGEKYFSQKLIDIDRAQNTGNWNWSSSYGLDSTTFLRIFNPWTQSKEYDPKCAYIKKWLPELKDIEPDHIHNWYKHYDKYENINYPEPIVDHSERRKKFIHFYKTYFKK